MTWGIRLGLREADRLNRVFATRHLREYVRRVGRGRLGPGRVLYGLILCHDGADAQSQQGSDRGQIHPSCPASLRNTAF